MHKELCFLFACIFALPTSSSSGGQCKNAGYVFLVPKVLHAGHRTNACVSFECKAKGSAILMQAEVVTEREKLRETTQKIAESDFSNCIPVRAPQTSETLAELTIRMKYVEDADWTITRTIWVGLRPSTVPLIETDRPSYKPGDKIRFRIALLTPELLPIQENWISDVRLVNPNGITVMQWANVSLYSGMIQLEHQLTEPTMMGLWQITVGKYKATKVVEVKEYILPRFRLYIHHRKNMYFKSDRFRFKVCAKYFFGSPVLGSASVRVQNVYDPEISSSQTKPLKRGCTDFVFHRSEIRFAVGEESVKKILAEVKEQGSEHSETAESTLNISYKKFNLKSDSYPYFQPGLPYNGKIDLINVNADTRNMSVRLCYVSTYKASWNRSEELCGKILVQKNSFSYTIPPQSVDTVKISVYAHPMLPDIFDSAIPEFQTDLHKMLTSAVDSIQVVRSSKGLIKCRSRQQFKILHTIREAASNATLHFHYFLLSRGQIIKSGTVHHSPSRVNRLNADLYQNVIGNEARFASGLSVDMFILTIRLPPNVAATSHLMVYFVNEEREVITGTLTFDVEKCLPNKVRTSWKETQLYPGEAAYLKIMSSAYSLCAISAVDSAAMLAENDMDFSPDKIYEEKGIWSENLHPFVLQQDNSCYDDRFAGEDDFDAMQFLKTVGLQTLTNLTIVTRKCSPTVRTWVEGNTLYDVQGREKGVAERKFFPETWLWEFAPVGKKRYSRLGEVMVKRYLPHSITSWTTRVVCLSAKSGIGVSQPALVRAFQPFFVELLMPYSIKRGEVLHAKVVVFNYLNHSLPVKISSKSTNDISLVDSAEDSILTACIASNDSWTGVFRLSANKSGRANVTVQAELDPSYPGQCGPEVLINKRDVIVKPLVVKPEGFPVEHTRSIMMCPNDRSKNGSAEVKWNIDIPEDFVESSAEGRISINSELIGVQVGQIDSLMKMPTGCGEQIMSTMAPNIYILQYKNATGTLDADLYSKVKINLQIGYEKVLSYRHKDGSFSVFGEGRTESSMFLTAFVLRTLSRAKSYINVEKHVLATARNWILQNQMENGCFPPISQNSIEYVTEQAEDEDITALTSYVTMSLVQSGLEIPDKVFSNVKYCLRAYELTDKYALALTTYVLALMDWRSEANRSMERILDSAYKKEDLIWWGDADHNSPVNIEMTSYVILGLLELGGMENLVIATSAARWLVTQSNARGGFYTTQDTVVALEALTRCALAIGNREPSSMAFQIDINGRAHRMSLANQDAIRYRSVYFHSFPCDVVVRVNGTGCAIIKASVKYNMREILNSELLSVRIDISSISTVDPSSVRKMHFCASYENYFKDNVKMALMDVELPSGYRVDRSSLFALTDKQRSKIKRFEEKDDRFVLYITNLNKEQVCGDILLNEHHTVDNRTRATVTLYDYYTPKVLVTKSYSIPHYERSANFPLPQEDSQEDIALEEVSSETVTEPQATTTDYDDIIEYYNELEQ